MLLSLKIATLMTLCCFYVEMMNYAGNMLVSASFAAIAVPTVDVASFPNLSIEQTYPNWTFDIIVNAITDYVISVSVDL